MYYVYILSNGIKNIDKAVLYIGVTNSLERRIYEHKNKMISGFTEKYNCTKLLFYEEFKYINEAISREKKLKNWHREWKINLIKEFNPNLEDLAKDWEILDDIDPEINSG